LRRGCRSIQARGDTGYGRGGDVHRM